MPNDPHPSTSGTGNPDSLRPSLRAGGADTGTGAPRPPIETPPETEIRIDRFRREDAEGVARCYTAIYGPDFPLDYVYDPSRVAETFTSPDHTVVVARRSDGEVVGLAGLFRSAPGAGTFETGQCLVLKEYRGKPARVARGLAAKIMEEVAFEQKIHALFAESVTHIGSTQKIGHDFGLRDCALEMNLMPPESYDREAGGGRRVSLLFQFRIYRDIPHEVHLPPPYRAQLTELYEGLGLDRRFAAVPGETGRPGETAKPWWRPAGLSRASAEHYTAAGVSRLTIREAGGDFPETIARFEAEAGGAVVLEAFIDLGSPSAPMAAEALRRSGYFFGGLLPLWFDRDGLLLQKLRERPDFDGPVLVSHRARSLLAMVRADWIASASAIKHQPA